MNAVGTLRERRVGLWTGTLDALPVHQMLEVAAEIEALGYGSLWFGEAYGRECLTTSLALTNATGTLVVGTGIANIYARGAMATSAAARLVHALAPGRFILGLGVSHQPLVERDRGTRYLPPVQAMNDFLDGMDRAPYFGADADLPPLALAALGPKMLELSRDRAAGAHPYLVTPEHTRKAREILGDGPLLVVEQAAVLNQDRSEGLRRAHQHLNIYTGLPNYKNSWLREGFTESDFVRGGSEKLAAALVVQGDEAAVRGRILEHLQAGADHVCVQLLGRDVFQAPLDEWRVLAPAVREI
ncbi:MAG TPA: LLM class F420-dependent oxidoreductase [Acidimicrobiales bacterium]|nr:LLM class F420-dependent oxidoreductase [Acidimicrobiales bacterium]